MKIANIARFISLTIIAILCIIIGVVTLTGCGTSVATNIKTTGLDGTIPIYGIPVGVRIGNAEVDTQALRGNATYITQTATGGGLWSGSAGTGKTTIFSTNPQFNEGYVAEVLVNPNVPESVKLAIAEKYLTIQKAPEVQPSSIKTLAAAAASGTDHPTIDPMTTGTDKLLEELSKNVPVVVEPMRDVANNAIDKTGDIVPSIMDTITEVVNTTSSTIIIISILVLGILILAGYLIYKYRKKQSMIAKGQGLLIELESKKK